MSNKLSLKSVPVNGVCLRELTFSLKYVAKTFYLVAQFDHNIFVCTFCKYAGYHVVIIFLQFIFQSNQMTSVDTFQLQNFLKYFVYGLVDNFMCLLREGVQLLYSVLLQLHIFTTNF